MHFRENTCFFFLPFDRLHQFAPRLPHHTPVLPLAISNLSSGSMSLVFMFWFVCLFRFHALQRSYGIFLSLSDLFHLAYCPQISSVLTQMAIFYYSMADEQPIVYIHHHLFIHSSMNGHRWFVYLDCCK